MSKEIKRYSIDQCALYKCRSKRRLEQLLCIEAGGLKEVENIILYHSFDLDKKCTKKGQVAEKRKITAPNAILKQIQARILYLLQKVQRPDWLISGEKGKCYIDNGKAHLLGTYVLTIDIKKFYDNCKREPVYRFFVDVLQTSNDVAAKLTDIVTFNDGIPTGCPTSQLLAFYAYQKMFTEINDVALAFNCKFTLYVDDMTFSSATPFNPKILAREVDKILRKYGHKPKYRKVKYYSKHDPKPITGTIVTPEHTLDVPNNLQMKVYTNFQDIKQRQGEMVSSIDEEKLLLKLKGQIQAAQNIDETRFPEIRRITSQIGLPTPKSSQRTHLKKSKKIRIPPIEK